MIWIPKFGGPKFSCSQDLQCRVASHWALNQISSFYCMKCFVRRKRAAFHSSTSSSSESDDEERFDRRKSRSMAMARQRYV